MNQIYNKYQLYNNLKINNIIRNIKISKLIIYNNLNNTLN